MPKQAVPLFILALSLLLFVHAPAADETPPPDPSLDNLRRQAEILHTTIHATLQLVHDRYYHEDEALPIPAAVLKEMFPHLESEQQVKLRWLAVEGLAMNSDHKPRTPFELDAAEALKSGRNSYEKTVEDRYLRAAPITLTNHCLKCHVPDRKNTNPRTAGLIISLPLPNPK